MKKAKQILALALVFILLAGTAAFADEPVFTERKGKGVEAWLWEELSQYSPSDVVTAGVLSYFWRESQYRSDAVAGWGSSLAGYGIDLCETVTEETDKGLEDGSSRSYFIRKARPGGDMTCCASKTSGPSALQPVRIRFTEGKVAWSILA